MEKQAEDNFKWLDELIELYEDVERFKRTQAKKKERKQTIQWPRDPFFHLHFLKECA